MLKRVLALLLAVGICFSLVACGGSASSGDEQQSNQPSTAVSLMEERMAAMEDCVAVLRMQINPAFDLYLDAKDTVLAIEFLNDDAREVLSHVEVVGQNGMDAIVLLMSAIFTSGLLKEDATLSVTPVYQAGNSSTGELVKDIPAVIADLKTGMQLPFALSVEMDGDGVVEDTSAGINGDGENDPAADKTDVSLSGDETDVEKDADGNIVKTVRLDEAGNIWTHYYHTSGQLEKETMEGPDGEHRETEFDRDGSPVKEIIDRADGSRVESFFTNGKATKTVQTDVHGTVMETTLDGNGTPLLTTGTAADGASIERTYHPNGEVKEATNRYADGAYNTQTFDENGVKLTYEGAYVNANGTTVTFKYLYDANGSETEYYGQDNFGRPVHTIYHSDGTSETYRTETDGSVTTIYRDAGGNEIYP